jgi:hypothetical protein
MLGNSTPLRSKFRTMSARPKKTFQCPWPPSNADEEERCRDAAPHCEQSLRAGASSSSSSRAAWYSVDGTRLYSRGLCVWDGGDDRRQRPEGPRRRRPQDRRKARGMEHAGPTSGDARPRGPTTTGDAGTGSGSRLGPRGQNRASARARRAEQLLASGYTARLTALAWMEGSWSTPTGTARCGRTVALPLRPHSGATEVLRSDPIPSSHDAVHVLATVAQQGVHTTRFSP